MKEYVIGIDIGGTKSHLALFDTEGNFIDLNHWSGLNHEGMKGSFKQFDEEFGTFAANTLSKHNITAKQVAWCTVGAAGVDTKQQHEIISRIIKNHGFENLTLSNDSYLGIYAGSKSGTGICAINGTGDSITGINRKGDMFQIGGLGYLSADMGGGHIGSCIISAVYRELFRKGEPTIMTKYLFEKLGIASKYDFIEKLCEKIYNGTYIVHKNSQLIFKAAGENDNVAKKILCDIAANYANGISGMIEELKFPADEELCVVLAGSVFVKGEHPIMVDTLKEKVSNDNPDHKINYNLLNIPNVAGAVISALNTLNGKNIYFEKVHEQMK